MTAPISESRLAEIEARASKATPGPWHAESVSECDCDERHDNLDCPCVEWCVPETLTVTTTDYDAIGGRDAEFIAASRQDVPDLVREVRRLRSVTDAFKAFRSSVGAVIERRGCEGDTPDGSCADYTPHDLCDPCELQAAVNRLDAALRDAGRSG